MSSRPARKRKRLIAEGQIAEGFFAFDFEPPSLGLLPSCGPRPLQPCERQVFERGPTIGADELLACGAISQEFYDEIKAAPAAPPATLVVTSVDRERGIVTFEAAP